MYKKVMILISANAPIQYKLLNHSYANNIYIYIYIKRVGFNSILSELALHCEINQRVWLSSPVNNSR